MATGTRARRRPAPTRTVGARPTATTQLSTRALYKKWLCYADSGAGKTVLGGSAPDACFLEFDPEGTESAAVFGSTAHEIPIPTWEAWQEALEYFEFGTGCQDFRWVIIDTVSEGEDVCWNNHLRTMKELKPSTRSLYKPVLEDYQIIQNKMLEVVEKFNRLPINVLYTAHVMAVDRYDEEKEEDYAETMPQLGSQNNGKLSRKVCAKVGLVGYLDVKKRQTEDGETEEFRRLYVSKQRTRIAKNRYGWTGYVDDPTMPMLIDMASEAQHPTPPARSPRRRSRRSA